MVMPDSLSIIINVILSLISCNEVPAPFDMCRIEARFNVECEMHALYKPTAK